MVFITGLIITNSASMLTEAPLPYQVSLIVILSIAIFQAQRRISPEPAPRVSQTEPPEHTGASASPTQRAIVKVDSQKLSRRLSLLRYHRESAQSNANVSAHPGLRSGNRPLARTPRLQPQRPSRAGSELRLSAAGHAARSGSHHLQPHRYSEERRARRGAGAREALLPRAHCKRDRGLDRAALPGGRENLRGSAEAHAREPQRSGAGARRRAQRFEPAFNPRPRDRTSLPAFCGSQSFCSKARHGGETARRRG